MMELTISQTWTVFGKSRLLSEAGPAFICFFAVATSEAGVLRRNTSDHPYCGK